MAVSTAATVRNKLGTFEFLEMNRAPIGQQQKIVIESRPGVNGISDWKTGERGRPF